MAPRTLLQRFEGKYKVCEKTGCWIWTGFRKNAYGGLKYKTKYLYAHRASYEAHISEIPDGMVVCHSCDNPLCVNPEHLWLGTQQDNIADRQEKRRHRVAKGAEHYLSKLDAETVGEIKRLLRDGVKQRDIARQFDLAESTISRIKN